MGYELRREIRDLLPRGGALTDKECRLILELADNANDETRRAWPGIDWLAAVCDIPNPKRVGEFLTSIARKWVELRVEIGKDRHGKPYFAKAGYKTVYRFPDRAELMVLAGEVQVPPTAGLDARKDPVKGGPQVPATGGAEVPPTAGAQVPAKGGPFSSGSPHNSPQPSPSPPASAIAPSSDLVVVDAEIVEEAEEIEASPKDRIQDLIGEVKKTRPNWSPVDLRTHITAALGLLDENFEAVTVLTLNTAKDPGSAHPSRITASGNPHLKQVNTALIVQRADAMPDPGPTNLHPDAHPFEPSDSGGPGCNRCEMPKANGRHRLGNQGGGYVGRTAASRANQHQPYRNPTDMSVYADWSVLGGPSPGASVRPGGTRHHLTDSHHPGRDYSEPI